jgi:hypothetical protein
LVGIAASPKSGEKRLHQTTNDVLKKFWHMPFSLKKEEKIFYKPFEKDL